MLVRLTAHRRPPSLAPTFSMPDNSPIPRQSFGRTFIVAATLLGVAALVQLTMVTWAFFHKEKPAAAQEDGARRPPEKIDIKKLIAESPPPEEPFNLSSDPLAGVSLDTAPAQGTRPFPVRPVPLNVDPVPAAIPEKPPAVPAHAVPISKVPGTGPLRPTPVPLSALTPKVDPRFSELVEQGKLLRGAGDTAGALTKFREAAALAPGDPLPIAEQAYTFEKMSLNDKASEQWKRILAMGERAGVYYSAAQGKLNTAIAETTRTVAPVPVTTAIPDGKILALGQPRMENAATVAPAKKFTLAVPIRARASETISVRDVKVFVLFFEKLNGKDIVRTSANVSNRWGSPPADWADGETETLEVTYDLAAGGGRGEPREYHGYIIRLYYKGELQDTQAEPAALNQKFPASFTLSE